MNMKSLTLLSFILVMTLQSFAQENPDKLKHLASVEKYRKMKNTGATLTVAGGILFIVGAVTIENSSYNMWTGDETSNFPAGAAAFIFGVAGLGSGIPLWIVGAHNQRKYNSKLEGLSVRINANTQSKGLTFTYRF